MCEEFWGVLGVYQLPLGLEHSPWCMCMSTVCALGKKAWVWTVPLCKQSLQSISYMQRWICWVSLLLSVAPDCSGHVAPLFYTCRLTVASLSPHCLYHWRTIGISSKRTLFHWNKVDFDLIPMVRQWCRQWYAEGVPMVRRGCDGGTPRVWRSYAMCNAQVCFFQRL